MLFRSPAPGPAAVVSSTSFIDAQRAVQAVREPTGLLQDDQFERRLRARERNVLTPLMGVARQWYASQAMPAPAALRSRASFSTTPLADADATLWFKLVNNSTVGAVNLQSVLGDLPPLVRDWSVSHAVDDVAAPATQYQQRSWNWHSIYPALAASSSPYPLAVQTLASTGTLVNSTVVAGGAAFYRVTVPAGGSVTYTLGGTSSTNIPNLQLVIVRTK